MPCQCRKICFLVLKPRFPCQGEKKEGRQRHLYQILRRLSLNHLKYVASSQKLGSGISLALGWSLKLIPCLVTVFFFGYKVVSSYLQNDIRYLNQSYEIVFPPKIWICLIKQIYFLPDFAKQSNANAIPFM